MPSFAKQTLDSIFGSFGVVQQQQSCAVRVYRTATQVASCNCFKSIIFKCFYEYKQHANEGLKMVTRLTQLSQHGVRRLTSFIKIELVCNRTSSNEGRIIVYSFFLRRDSKFGAYSWLI